MLDQALRTAHMLDINICVMTQLQAAAEEARVLDTDDNAVLYTSLNNYLGSSISEHGFLRKEVLSLVARATILSNQVCIYSSLENMRK
jgi:ABC-type antimicrobial peptide transport system ATPase subunit